MKLSRESRYGVEALLHLAGAPPGSFVTTEDIAAHTSAPPGFLTKIMRRLVGGGILVSRRGGAQRGYALARPAEHISVREILECLDGRGLFERCLFWPDPCSADQPCPLHACWGAARAALADVTGGTSLAALRATKDTDPAADAEQRLGREGTVGHA